jgi:hypothetical protein
MPYNATQIPTEIDTLPHGLSRAQTAALTDGVIRSILHGILQRGFGVDSCRVKQR